MKKERIKGDKDEYPLLRIRKQTPRPGSNMGNAKKYSRKQRRLNKIKEV